MKLYHCCICKNWFAKDKFYKAKSRVTGIQGRCKICDKARSNARYKANPELHKFKMKLYRTGKLL